MLGLDLLDLRLMLIGEPVILRVQDFEQLGLPGHRGLLRALLRARAGCLEFISE